MTFVSLVWTILLCVEVFLLDEQSDPSQRNFVGVFIFVDAFTAILLPVLLIVPFRPWLDAARFLFLLLAHLGTAILFTVWNPSFRCPTETNAEHDRCQSVNLVIMICGWVIPALLIWYSAFLGLMYYWRKEHPLPECVERRASDLPMMLPSRRASTKRPSIAPTALGAGPLTATIHSAPPADKTMSTHASHMLPPSWLASPSTPVASSSRTPPQCSVLTASVYTTSESVPYSTRSSGRLSKPAPLIY
ncbi:hypothetical protein BD414DRAFT_475187 [Trametes punicea]|nr:hypothetical protein BD414DRAFT_475187 [Trametes punicea]